jgi:hypothetical protein
MIHPRHVSRLGPHHRLGAVAAEAVVGLGTVGELEEVGEGPRDGAALLAAKATDFVDQSCGGGGGWWWWSVMVVAISGDWWWWLLLVVGGW